MEARTSLVNTGTPRICRRCAAIWRRLEGLALGVNGRHWGVGNQCFTPNAERLSASTPPPRPANPASTMMFCPVMPSESLAARNRAVRATWPGSRRYFKHCSSMNFCPRRIAPKRALPLSVTIGTGHQRVDADVLSPKLPRQRCGWTGNRGLLQWCIAQIRPRIQEIEPG